MRTLLCCLILAARMYGGTLYGGSITAVKVSQTPFPACRAVAFPFTIQAKYNANLYDCNGKLIRTYGPLTATGAGFCSGAFFICANDPAFLPETSETSQDGRDFLFTITVISADPGPPLSCGGYHQASAGPLNIPLPVCCQKPTNCDASCLPQCDGSCKCTPIAVRFGSHYDFVSLNQGPFFRVDPDGPQQQMTWPTGKTGWLVRPDSHGEVNSIKSEMFDYPRLAELDLNRDKKIDRTEGRDLRIWFDNGDGVVQSGELHSLPELKIDAISLAYHELGWDNGKGTEIWLVSAVDTPQLNKPCEAADTLITVRP